MTLDEAIKHAEEVMAENLEKTKGRKASDPIAINCFECADEHRQLAEWLKELKAYREHSGDEESLTAFCPNCGARMSESKYYAGLSKSFAQGLRQGLQEGFAESEDKK